MLAEIVKNTREDKAARLKTFKVAKNKMDDEEIEMFYKDIYKVDKNEKFVMEISGTLNKCFGTDIADMMSTSLMPLYAYTLIDI